MIFTGEETFFQEVFLPRPPIFKNFLQRNGYDKHSTFTPA